MADQQELWEAPEPEPPKAQWSVKCAVRYERIYWMPPRYFDTEADAKRYGRESLRVGLRDVAFKIELVEAQHD